ncbi:hypothetical protein EZ449_19910 [Pedobacter frigidisoli]|uniref:M23ase beta-sheet core domain-containing protein n=1 Tax=Pedobacter frigidisoli TaxID=2530455 RepID=A0A4R0NNL0_9SPHI|nr:peptidoglycan DD-metalloendopeptidase family protein [Pedobacter frigidisoli]TCD00765.1 hypothetical protein EZ449_19910 [Pedobacter frigidisoli]
MQQRILPLLSVLFISSIIISCKTGSINLFKADSLHEQYQRKLETAGLDKTAMGAAWINSATSSIEKALTITVPFKEVGYFSAEKIPAAAYKFSAIKGQKLTISSTKKPTETALYLDFWFLPENGKPKLVASADTLNSPLKHDIDDTGNYLIRLQPELLKSIEYTLEITSGPSLAFPIKSKNSSNSIKSYWGDGRDNNIRKHEGIDIFGTFRSPVLSIAEGTITRVNENNLGGKVVWLRPKGKDYTVYYAHLDEQIATEGQVVKIGDTVGLMGNTGNAKTTPTHLHFGIYTAGGAINPLPFIDPISKLPVNIGVPISNLNKTLRTSMQVKLLSAPQNRANVLANLEAGTIINVNSATGNYYRAELPDGNTGFIQSSDLAQTSKPLRMIKVNPAQIKLYNQPDSLSPVKLNLKAGQWVSILGIFNNFQLVSDENSQVGWIVK